MQITECINNFWEKIFSLRDGTRIYETPNVGIFYIKIAILGIFWSLFLDFYSFQVGNSDHELEKVRKLCVR